MQKAFGKYRKSIIKDMTEYLKIYNTSLKTYEKLGEKIPKTLEQFVTDEVNMTNELQTLRDINNLDKNSLDFRNKEQYL